MPLQPGDRITWSPQPLGLGPHGPRRDHFGTVLAVRQSRFTAIGAEVVYEEDGLPGTRGVQALIYVQRACAQAVAGGKCVLPPQHDGEHRPGR